MRLAWTAARQLRPWPDGDRTGPVVDLPAECPVLDLSVTSTLLPEATWTDREATRTALEAALADGYGVAGSGGALPFVVRDQAAETPSVRLGSDAFVPVGTAVRAPAKAEVVGAGGGTVVLRGGDVDVTLSGLEPAVAIGTTVAAGEVVGRVLEAAASVNPLPAHVHAQVTPAGVAAPGLVEPSLARAWRPSPPRSLPCSALPSRNSQTMSSDELVDAATLSWPASNSTTTRTLRASNAPGVIT